MLDKDLFFSLCEKYNVELSDKVDKPMIREGAKLHPVTSEDVKRVFTPCKIYFDYSCDKISANEVPAVYCLQEDFGVAC